MRIPLYTCMALVIVVGVSTLVQPAQASISYSTLDGVAMQFPGLVAPPANAAHVLDGQGYPGDTVELQGYTGMLSGPGTFVQKINTLHWTIDWTYAGDGIADSNPDVPWSELLFNIDASQSMTVGSSSDNLSQAGTLEVNYDNDFVSLSDGSTTSFFVPGFQIDVTPLGIARFGGTNFDGDPAWAQPDVDVMARFVVTELAVPEPTMFTVFSTYSLGGGVIVAIGWWRRRKSAV